MDHKQCQALNSDVATRVMGWTLRCKAWAYSERTNVWHRDDGTPLATDHNWRPHADDRQLGQVIERMIELGYRLRLEVSALNTSAQFIRDEAKMTPTMQTHNERRIAVLKAALAALGEP